MPKDPTGVSVVTRKEVTVMVASKQQAAPVKIDALWQRCEGPDIFHKACKTPSKMASRMHVTAGHAGRVICGRCASREGLKRTNRGSITDTVSQRASMTSAQEVAAATVHAHKGEFAREVKGGVDPKAAAVIGRRTGRTTIRATDEGSGKAPAKVAGAPKKPRVAKPAAKVA